MQAQKEELSNLILMPTVFHTGALFQRAGEVFFFGGWGVGARGMVAARSICALGRR
jgi:hypothetical protein